MSTDQAYSEANRPLEEIESRQSKWTGSESAECASDLSGYRELNWPNAAVSEHASTSLSVPVSGAEIRTTPTCIHALVTVGEYIECKFVPEYVATKTSAGRTHFRSSLKFVLTPDTLERSFKTDSRIAKRSLAPIPGWPYMDSMPLCDVTRNWVQTVVSGTLNRGYSVQTATHIRNVIRTIFRHASQNQFFFGENPAAEVTLPRMVRKAASVLTLDQLKSFLQVAHHPEREIALMSALTTMSIAEICGLQWKYINGSELRRWIDGEWLDARTIAVRMQSCRGEFGPVLSSRKRNVRVPELLSSVLSHLRGRTDFSGPDDFVFASRRGSPISQDNLASRRLKAIGEAHGIPRLSWHVFPRSYNSLYAKLGRQLYNELKTVTSVERRSLPTS
jgi:integrase